ncbi:MAG TPA: phage holin family protein [Solirubrobacteraceae bacterium]|nr:phage holin family protein [Solirubrobacteraceae bacterium]
MNDPSAGGEVPRGIAAAITEVSERATSLVREEIELAKVEVAQKATRLAKGAVIGIVAGVFFLTALFFFLIGCAWLLYYYLPGNDFTYFWGFFAMAVILVLLGVLAGLIAAKAVKRGAPPTPDMAIEEARLIRETVSAPEPRPQAPPTDAPSAAGRPAPGSSPAAGPPASEESTSGAPSASGTSSVSGSASAPYGAATPPSPQEEAS